MDKEIEKTFARIDSFIQKEKAKLLKKDKVHDARDERLKKRVEM